MAGDGDNGSRNIPGRDTTTSPQNNNWPRTRVRLCMLNHGFLSQPHITQQLRLTSLTANPHRETKITSVFSIWIINMASYHRGCLCPWRMRPPRNRFPARPCSGPAPSPGPVVPPSPSGLGGGRSRKCYSPSSPPATKGTSYLKSKTALRTQLPCLYLHKKDKHNLYVHLLCPSLFLFEG